MFVGLAGLAFVIFLLAMRHLAHLHSNDLGSMSQQWLNEYNAQHP